MTVQYIVGDTRAVTATIPDGTVSLVACSPPFIALRSYLPADHPDKDKEIGSEPDPATFVDTLLALTAEWGRVLAPWGSIAIELGDTFSGSGGAGGDYGPDGMRGEQSKFKGSALADRKNKVLNDAGQRMQQGPGWPRAKCLALVPEAYRLSLAYGRNVLNGNPSPAGRWLIRNVITWARPNPAVGALGDKYRPATSQIVVATRSAQRWFDLTAVRTEGTGRPSTVTNVFRTEQVQGEPVKGERVSTPAGAPPLDCWYDEYDGTPDTWTITTQPSKLAHYAMWPAKLAERLILSMCPEWVCSECGEPRRRIEAKTPEYLTGRGKPAIMDLDRSRWPRVDESVLAPRGTSHGDSSAHRVAATTGWTTCGCDADYRPGVVLDPFAGTFTTGAVADLHHRDAIGIDIDARNRELYPRRRAEVARNLFGSPIPDPAQLDLFGAAS